MKKIVILAVILLLSLRAAAQSDAAPQPEKEGTGVDVTLGADFVNQYIWRGLDEGDVSIQPTLGIAYRGLSLAAWGSIGVSNKDDAKELDLTLSYATGGLTVGIVDYWFSEGLDPDNRYFRYNAHSTNHVFEAFATYDFGPVALGWYTNFAGNDGKNKSGRRAYSSYMEASVPFSLVTVGWTATVGAVPYATDFYDTNGFAVTNLSLRAEKDIRVTDSFSIPVFAQLVGNPCSQKAHMVFGFTLQID